MRQRAAWLTAVGLAGFAAGAAAQTPPANRPDPAAFLLPPVAAGTKSPPARRVDGGSDLPPPPPSPYDEPAAAPPPPVTPTRRVRPPDDDRDEFRPASLRRDRFEGTPPPPPPDDRDPPPPPARPGRRVPLPPVRDPAPDAQPVAPKARPDRYEPAATLARPRDVVPVSAEAVEQARAAGDPKKPDLDLIGYLTDRQGGRPPADDDFRTTGWKFGDKLRGVLTNDGGPVDNGRTWFESDRAFPTYVSPVTNPFLFEDPRSTTELRPIFVYQSVPGKEPVFGGGDLYFVGGQARLAFTDRLSLVIHKLGGIGANADNTFNGFFNQSEFGFAEFWLGPKFTIIRDTEFGTLLAAGAQFQLPIGSDTLFQNTGSLSVVPWATLGQNFLQTRLGSFNGLIGTGYAASVNSQRSEYYFLSGHLDFDVGNSHIFYPLAELNYVVVTRAGSSTPFNFEGRDLINFGAAAAGGSNLLTGALGCRIKVFGCNEVGAAFEIPLVGNRDLFDYRFTVDFIWRF